MHLERIFAHIVTVSLIAIGLFFGFASDIQITHLTQCEMSSEQGRNIVVTMLFKESLKA